MQLDPIMAQRLSAFRPSKQAQEAAELTDKLMIRDAEAAGFGGAIIPALLAGLHLAVAKQYHADYEAMQKEAANAALEAQS